MKNYKKHLALLLSAAMIFVQGSIVFADGEDNETVTPGNEVVSGVSDNNNASDETAAPGETAAPDEAVPGEENKEDNNVVPQPPVPAVTSIALESNEKYPFQTKEFGPVTKTYVSLRQCAELLNAAIEWQESDKSVHIVKGSKYLRLVIDQPTFNVYDFDFNGKLNMKKGTEYSLITDEEKTMLLNGGLTGNEIAPILTDINGGSTYLPIRAVAEALFGVKAPNGAETVAWVDGVTTFNISNDEMAAGSWDDYLAVRFKDGSIPLPEIGAEPVVEKGSVSIKVKGNFEGADPALGDGVVVTLDGKTQTAANGGACTFAEVNAGTYTLTVSSIPEGYTAAETTVTVEAGKEASVSILLEKAADDKDNDNKDNGENSKSDDQQTQKKNETKDNAGNGNNTGSAAENGDKSGDAANK